jgi:hypothetical protein
MEQSVEMRIGRGNRNARIKPVPLPHRPPQISHVLSYALTWDAAVGSRHLTA